MSVLDELRESVAVGYISDRSFSTKTIDALFDAFEAEHPVTEYRLRIPDACDAELPTLCGDCRHWGGEPDSAKLGPCLVSGSFRAPGGLFTERDFGCIHGRKS